MKNKIAVLLPCLLTLGFCSSSAFADSMVRGPSTCTIPDGLTKIMCVNLDIYPKNYHPKDGREAPMTGDGDQSKQSITAKNKSTWTLQCTNGYVSEVQEGYSGSGNPGAYMKKHQGPNEGVNSTLETANPYIYNDDKTVGRTGHGWINNFTCVSTKGAK